ncbi:MAG: hypothetical protein K1X72_10640 [Pyrinomonadaceae bacterium]|nr:hypothetical protein [Pyrinomonadaceae bacterium]
MSRLVGLSEQILLRLLSFSLAFCVSLIAFLPALNFQEEQKLRRLNVEIYKRPLNERCLPKPFPLPLLVHIKNDRSIEINREDFGNLENTSDLESRLTNVFGSRELEEVFNEEGTRIEKSVIIRPDNSINYSELAGLIDALNRTGANPIILDPLDEYCGGGGGG